jgi:hypothetical protein
MPAIVDPYGARAYSPPDPNLDLASGKDAISLSSRVRTAVHREKLTRALAEGAESSASRELELRARQLTSERNRRTLARSLRRTLAEARRPALTRARVVIIERAAVLDAEAAIAEMIERLRNPDPVRAEGMALLERILTHADSSPLYNKSEPGALRRMIGVATSALDVDPSRSHEFGLGA